MFAFIALAALPLCATTFTVSIDRDTIVLGDTATLALKFADGQVQGTPQLPPIPGLQIAYASADNAFSFVNGRSSSTVTYKYEVRPAQVGDFTIPALTVKLGDEALTSEAVKFKVIRAAAPAPGSAEEEKQLTFIRLAVPKTNVVVGETITVELQLFINGVVQNTSNPDLPALQPDGCIAGKWFIRDREGRQTRVGNTPFKVYTIQAAATVTKSGRISIGPVDGSIVAVLPSRGQRDAFDPFGMFNQGVQQRITLAAPGQTITATALPEAGKPASFSGAVGSYQMAVNASPTNVAVGDPITIRVQIKGRGALDAFTLPDQPAWKEFKAYPPTVKTETTGDLGLDGTKSFEQIVVPQNTEIKELPQFDFAYFDPDTRRYETLHQPALPIIVRPAGSTPTPTLAAGGTTSDNPKSAQDIVHIKPRLGSVSRSSTVWVKQTWFIALQGLPVLALIGAVLWRKRSDALANNPRLRRQQQVAQIVSEGLEQLHPLAAAGQADEFFATVFRLMQEQIGERLNLPASAITEAVVDERLRPRGLGEAGADVLHELFRSCNQARYAPEESAHKLEAVIPKLKMALSELQEVKG